MRAKRCALIIPPLIAGLAAARAEDGLVEGACVDVIHAKGEPARPAVFAPDRPRVQFSGAPMGTRNVRRRETPATTRLVSAYKTTLSPIAGEENSSLPPPDSRGGMQCAGSPPKTTQVGEWRGSPIFQNLESLMTTSRRSRSRATLGERYRSPARNLSSFARGTRRAHGRDRAGGLEARLGKPFLRDGRSRQGREELRRGGSPGSSPRDPSDSHGRLLAYRGRRPLRRDENELTGLYRR
jgi:hypothetical protein